jgi:phenylalanyl-tRNA synthetase beta chain
MKFTLNWLKEFIELTGAPEELARRLTMAGLEVESLTALREPETDREDWLFEIAVTPNRGDCLGLVGIAREVSALTGAHLKSFPTNVSRKDPSIDKRVTLTIENDQLCPRYSARIVDDIRIAQSPAWLRYRLEACGVRAINNIVDVTNYVMLETGQPLHAFDFDRLAMKKIVVRPAKETKKFTTLDGVERELAHEDLLVCDGDTPVALAGVMGGMNSEVTDVTRSILLESANFAPSSIRRTAKRLALHSEASHRFERGVDPEGTIHALDRAVWLIAEIAGGNASAGAADRHPGKAKPAMIRLREERIEKLLGVRIDLKEAEKLLRSLGLKTERQAKSRGLKVSVPTSRPDLAREADLIEELARLRGYDQIPTTLPLLRPAGGTKDYHFACERKLRSFFAGEGLIEVINLPFTTEAFNQSFKGLWERSSQSVAVVNPLAKEIAAMRHSLLPGLIDDLRVNLAHKAKSFRAYHIGKIFRLDANGESEERQCIAGLLHGARPRLGLRLGEETPQPFLDCKGLIEGLLDLLKLRESVHWSDASAELFHPGRSVGMHFGQDKVGHLGQLHPNLCERLEVPPICAFELDFEKLLEYAPRRMAARALPRFPSIERDLAIVVDRDFASQRIIAWIESLGEPLIEYAQVFDQYLGAPIPEGKKSLAYNISYRAEDRTLTDTEVNQLHQSLVDRLGKEFGAEWRS